MLYPLVKDADRYSNAVQNLGSDFVNQPFSEKDLKDFSIQVYFPVPTGTEYAEEFITLEPPAIKYWGELYDNYLPDDYYGYNGKLYDLLKFDFKKEMFKEHSLFLLKAHLKAFAPYHRLAKKLLVKLENLE